MQICSRVHCCPEPIGDTPSPNIPPSRCSDAVDNRTLCHHAASHQHLALNLFFKSGLFPLLKPTLLAGSGRCNANQTFYQELIKLIINELSFLFEKCFAPSFPSSVSQSPETNTNKVMLCDH